MTNFKRRIVFFALELNLRNQMLKLHQIPQVECKLSDRYHKVENIDGSLPFFSFEQFLGFLESVLDQFFVKALSCMHRVREDVDPGVVTNLDQIVVE